ncbi:MAG: metal-dependent transcriptional regulator [Candidatus Bathyarchaeota archaeon]|nr:metal-dependent transcriptional regulator [Candidatus Bathyarchaeota archaeon]
MSNTMEEVTPTVEEYLECIYRLEEKYGLARTRDIVKMMDVAPGTVTNTIEWLERSGLVTHQPYRGVKLTSKGQMIAIRVLRKHRLAERLLVDVLRVEWEKAHDLACKLEHGLTEEVIKPLERFLKHPKTCPHGNPIPNEYGVLIREESVSLTDLEVGSESVITRIIEEHKDLLQYLSELGAFPGVVVKVLGRNPVDGSLKLTVGGKPHVLSSRIASVIHVKKLAEDGVHRG